MGEAGDAQNTGRSLEYMEGWFSSSSTTLRVSRLRTLEEKLLAKDFNDEDIPQVLARLFDTYAFYHDRSSRRAVQQCLQTIFSMGISPRRLEKFVDALKSETTKVGLAPSSAFVLVEWCSIILQESARNQYWEEWGFDVLVCDAQVLELCQGSSSREGVRRSALTVTRRAVRQILASSKRCQEIVHEAVARLTLKGAQATAKNITMLGVISGVCARRAEARSLIIQEKSEIYSFYTREILGSRVQLPPHVANGLHDFFCDFTTQDDIEIYLTSPLEKGLLRAPEIILNDLVTPLLRSLHKDVDLSDLVQNHLLKSLLSNIKSTNALIRQGALAAFIVAIGYCHKEEAIEAVSGQILEPLKSGKIASAEQRALYSEMLNAMKITKSLVHRILPSIAAVANKEASDVALAGESMIVSRYIVWSILSDAEIPHTVLATLAKGVADKKIPIRKLWAMRFGEVVWELNSDAIRKPEAIKLLTAVLPSMLDLWTEININVTAAAQSGLASSAFVLIAIVAARIPHVYEESVDKLLAKSKVAQEALVIEPKPSVLLNHRVFSKLSTPEDLVWTIRALESIASDVVSLDHLGVVATAWSQGMIYCITSTSISATARREAIQALSRAYLRQPTAIAATLVNGLWKWLGHLESDDKDCAAAAAKSERSNLHLVVRAICVPDDKAASVDHENEQRAREEEMISLLILAREDILPNVNWIELCLRVEIDPGELCRKHAQALIREIVLHTSFDVRSSSGSSKVQLAACNAASDLAFVAPELMIPLLVQHIKEDLDPKQLEDIGPTEVAISRTSEGTAFVDVLAKKTDSYIPNKNTKDYEILEWENSLRAQLATKKGQQKKLTPEENAKVNAQLAKEAGIRDRVRSVQTRLYRGIHIIKALAEGPPTEAQLWLGFAVRALVDVISGGAGLLTGDAGPEAYIACADRITPRIGTLRPFVGIATLRALDIPQLPERLKQEPLGALITRVLYRLRFSAEQRPFDTVSLMYMLPLIFLVLNHGGYGQKDDAEAQLVLALEFLAFHTDVCSDILVPRGEVLSILISSMQSYNQHYKIIKDCLSDLCRCIAPNITATEIAVLLSGSIVSQSSVRTSVLQSISAEIDLSDMNHASEIWLACHDDVEENVELGREIWEESDFTASKELVFGMLPYLNSMDKQLRRAAARSLAEGIQLHQSSLQDVVDRLESSYLDLAKPRLPQLDEYGMPKKTDLSDPWEARNGIALAFKELSVVFDENLLDSFLQFLIERGPLGDRDGNVRQEMVDAATAVIALHGKNKVEELMMTFEHTLEAPDRGDEFHDRINEAVIILYGALARHLEPGDSRVPAVVDRLLATLSTPSETVQYAVAECLPPLVQASKENTAENVHSVVDALTSSKKYAARRGAAYGLAGIVHGAGIGALREYRIMLSLRSAGENKKDVNHREGALLAYELLPTILGRIFEPYVIQIVPQLLSNFGDASADVREACLAAAKACFASLSSYGVKKILPTLLDGLEDQQWRSKKGACDLLGAMAYLDPQQLAQSLPEIIPPLTGVLNDSHKEVRLAANRSLKRFGEVISNPEIKSLVDILLKALSDPTKHTDAALDALIKVSFVHYLDAPSLALVVRILERGLGDRSATKRKSAQVIGSLAHLTERRDLIAHLPILVAGLKSAIVDPVPTTRATASKALGSLIEKLGEDALPDLIPGLMQTLKSDTGAGDRLGSAQALSEVLAGLGTGRLEEILPTILQNVSSAKAAVREGFMSLFIFLPVCFGNSFANYLSKVIPPILAGLADDVESIRDTSLRAGRLLVKNFATRAIDLLLPELERGLADDSYRIRLSSVELVGDLLFNLTGISATTEQEEDEDNAQEAGASLLEVLGEEKRNKVLSSLYICRCDTSGLVRTAAVNVWKALVASPRTLKELIPTLTQLIIRRLGSSNIEQKVIAGNALGELIRKAGDGVLSTLLPTLEEGLQTSTDSDAKQGICIALRELISSASPEALEDHEKTLTAVVRTALIDSDEDVREAAAEAFDSLQQIFGKRAVDQVLPHLLNLLRTEGEAENALSALLTLLTETTRSNIILPNLIPTLTAAPITSFNARALASLSTVAGSAMTRRLPNIINSLMDNLISCKDDERRVDLETSLDTVILSIDEYDGLNTTMSVLLALVKHDDHRRRAAVGNLLTKFFTAAQVDYSRYNQDIIRALLNSFDDRDTEVVKTAWSALNEFTKRLKKEEMESLVFSTRQSLQHVGVAGANLPGFALPKGINAILPIFLQGLMNGTAEQRTQAALAISDIIDRTSGDSLKPFVTQITGPLIRVVSERSTDVKAAILLTLNNLLEKIPLFLKPFLPQLQRTFAKSLADTSSEVLRSRAAKALGTLITLTPRIDPLIAELVTGSRTTDAGVRNAMVKALYEVISKAGANMSEASRTAVLALIDTDADDNDDAMAITNAKLLGALIKNVSAESAAGLIKNRVMTTHFTHASILALNSVLLESATSLTESSFAADLPHVICQALASKNTFVSDNAVLAAGKFLLSEPSATSFESSTAIFTSLANSIQPGQPVDMRRLSLVVVRTASRHNASMVKPHLALLAPSIFASVRDPVIPVKLAAEAAFLTLFSVMDEESRVFDKYLEREGANLPAHTKRAMQDYFKRVAMRLGAQARERREAEGGQGGLGLSSDEVEDEKEIWSVGRVDLGDGVFSE